MTSLSAGDLVAFGGETLFFTGLLLLATSFFSSCDEVLLLTAAVVTFLAGDFDFEAGMVC